MVDDCFHTSKQKLVKKALLLEWVLVSYNVIEAVAAVLFGYLAGSIALVGFGFDSVIEVSAALMLIWRLSHHGTEAEESKKEKIALFFVGITFFVLAIYVVIESVGKFVHQDRPEISMIGIVIASLSLAIMPTIGLMKKRIAKELGSKALAADAMETLICAYLSFALLLGLGLNALFGWWWADPVAALAMVYFIVKEGLEAIGDATHGEK
jgi:cation diffusion facilitator family transporter